ncbi:WXG100-like domain-containing protein [Nocardia sp. NPDC001965]
MSIHIPSEVVFFLQVCGIPYPDVDVDQVRELGQSVSEFAADVRESYEEATAALKDMQSVMSGNSYQTILVVWSFDHGKMSELDTLFNITAKALDIAADVIEAFQIAVLIELAALAASFIANMFTPAGPVTGPLIAAAARQIAKSLAEALMWYIAAEVMMKAIQPLLEKFDHFIRDTLLPPDAVLPDPGSNQQVHLDPDEALRYIDLLEKRADEMLSHADKFGDKLDGFDFQTPGLDVPPAEWPSPVSVEPPVDGGQRPPSLSNIPDLTQHPRSDAPSESASGKDSPASADRGVGSSTNPNGTTAPTVQSSGSDAGIPTSRPGADGATPSGITSAGTDLPVQGSSSSNVGSSGSENSGANTVGPVGSVGSGGYESTESRVGETGGMMPAATAQPAASASNQSNASAPNAQQRPTDAAANRAQSGTGGSGTGGSGTGGSGGSGSGGRAQGGAARASAGPGTGAQPPAGRPKTAATPWSRAGKKSERVAPTTKPSDEKVPAISASDVDQRGVVAEQSQEKLEGQQASPQVFAPDTAAPPPESSSEKATEHDGSQDVPAEPAPKAESAPKVAVPPQ